MAQRLVYIIVTGHLYNPFGRFIQIKMPSNVPISNFPCHSIIQRTELLLNPLFKLVYEVIRYRRLTFIQSAILTANPYLLLSSS